MSTSPCGATGLTMICPSGTINAGGKCNDCTPCPNQSLTGQTVCPSTAPVAPTIKAPSAIAFNAEGDQDPVLKNEDSAPYNNAPAIAGAVGGAVGVIALVVAAVVVVRRIRLSKAASDRSVTMGEVTKV
jgi:hypothetical protein